MEKIKYKEHGTFTFEIGNSLSQKTKEIPRGYGVYIIYANSIDGELLYIGKGGTIHTNGDFDKQQLKERLKKKQEKNIYREDEKLKKELSGDVEKESSIWKVILGILAVAGIAVAL